MTDIKLPALPKHHSEDWWTDASEPPCKFIANRLYTETQLRTYALEVARVVLEAAAQCADVMAWTAAQKAIRIADAIRNLEVSHD